MADRRRKGTSRRSSSWVSARKTVQVLSFLLFLLAFLALRSSDFSAGSSPGGGITTFVKIPLRLDPLVMLAEGLANRQIVAGSILALVTILFTLGLGRVWCGWLCPLGTLLDWIPSQRKEEIDHAGSWRRVKYLLLITTLAAAIFSNLTLLILDPLTLLYRTFSTAIWPGLDVLTTAGETALYRFSFLQPVIGRLDTLLRPGILPNSPVYYRYTFLYAGFFAAVLALNLVAHRFWCRSFCPLGALFAFLGKFSVLKHTIRDSCSGCGLCLSVCPTGAIFEEEGVVTSDPGECTLCMDCLGECPPGAVAFSPSLSMAEWQPYDPGRRQVLLGMGASLIGVGLMGTNAVSKGEHPYLIRPPGVNEEDFLEACVRCGACVRGCPTGALQPSLFESGLEGLWSPLLVPRLGYCDYACHACGQVCPVEAIPQLSLNEKREQIMGAAYIDRDRCIAWADQGDCIVCEEMCPVSDKAIILEEVEVLDGEGEPITVRQPHVRRELCIGCGICEYKCPLPGPAAIRVYTASLEVMTRYF